MPAAPSWRAWIRARIMALTPDASDAFLALGGILLTLAGGTVSVGVALAIAGACCFGCSWLLARRGNGPTR